MTTDTLARFARADNIACLDANDFTHSFVGDVDAAAATAWRPGADDWNESPPKIVPGFGAPSWIDKMVDRDSGTVTGISFRSGSHTNFFYRNDEDAPVTRVQDSASMLALTIQQPWAHAAVHLGMNVHNRGWSTDYRGPILIHAARRPSLAEINVAVEWMAKALGVRVDREELEFEGIIGRAELVDVVTTSSSPWFTGPIGFVLCNVEPLPFQPCRGQLGLFEPQVGFAAASNYLIKQLSAARQTKP